MADFAYVVVPIVAAVIAALATYLVARRTGSGQVTTSDAATLFAEERQFRHDVLVELDQTKVRCSNLEAEVGRLTGEVHRLERELDAAKRGA